MFAKIRLLFWRAHDRLNRLLDDRIPSHYERRIARDNNRLLARIADLQAEVAELEVQVREEQSRSRIKDVEIEELSGVIARNRTRVDAETAIEARKVADAG